MLIDIPLMRGEVPRLKPHLLPNEAAVIAKDCCFENGIIRPLFNDLAIATLPIEAKTLFKYTDDHWFVWNKRIEAIHNPMAQDKWQRVYFSGENKPKVTAQDIAIGVVSPAASYDLGVPAPSSAPVINRIDSSTGSEPEEGQPDIFDDETRFYIQTFVTRFGEEGAPSKPSTELLVEKPGSTVYVGLSRLNTNTNNITHTRLYRTVTSSVGAEYMLVAELPIAQVEYADSAKTLNAPIVETWDYDVPDEKMRGLCVMANGICAGFAGNEVMFSEAFLPYVWPKQYRGTTEHQIVGIAAIGTSLVVVTKGYPYIFGGVTPSAINGTKIGSEQACVSKESIVVVNGTVIYASPDGLIAIGSDGAITITDQLMTRRQWQTKIPHTIKAWGSEGMYIALYEGGGFIFDPVSQDFRELSNRWDCAYEDLERDQLVIVQGNEMCFWQGGDSYLSGLWRSKVFQLPVDSLMSCARVVSTEINQLSLKIFGDGQLVYSLNKGEVPHNGFRLPAIRATNWQIEVSGRAEVERLMVASSMQELM
ncbi:hypothetical protein C0W59_19160 [Photobacterium kishitanii]|uniref:hypothetical protein n=1 Tax=Photobacterium kishitanii TaxID=318456 RepID=UPI000D170243|nr:hypothetical protein [Photobacterium kishitanii]PSV11654.1 hypothetical protein C0W59_19160 [Photobacterium kishitanii]